MTTIFMMYWSHLDTSITWDYGGICKLHTNKLLSLEKYQHGDNFNFKNKPSYMYIQYIYLHKREHTHIQTWHYALSFIHNKKQTLRSVIVKCPQINIKWRKTWIIGPPSLCVCVCVCVLFYDAISIREPIKLAARSKAWTLFARSDIRVVGSNPIWGMDVGVRLFCLRWSPVQGVLPTVKRIKKLNKWPRSNKRNCRAMDM
jgi:hypothetical protein